MSYIEELGSKEYSFVINSPKYTTKDGRGLPSVTEILGKTIHNDSLMYWANSLGFKHRSYKATMAEAADIGTQAHSNIENYFKNKEVDNENVPFQGFLGWWYNFISEEGMKFSVIGQEESLTNEWFGGTYDMLLDVNGRPILVDFKTSNHVTVNYFLQLAAYSVLLKDAKNITPAGFIVLKLDKYIPMYDEYFLSLDDPKAVAFMAECVDTFWSLVCAFYNTRNIETLFNDVFKGRKGVLKY